MKKSVRLKLYSFVTALSVFIVIAVVMITGTYRKQESIVSNKLEAVKYWPDEYREDLPLRDSNKEILTSLLDQNTIAVFGSSELHAYNDVSFPSVLYSNNNMCQFDMLMIGDSWCQSLIHAINMGAAGPALPGKKAVLVLSPQWFEFSMTPDIFSQVFEYQPYAAFMSSDVFSDTLKRKVAERVKVLLESSPSYLEKVKGIEDVYLHQSYNPFLYLQVYINDKFQKFKSVYKFGKAVERIAVNEEKNNRDINYEDLIREGDLAAASLTHNEFHALDTYYDLWKENGSLEIWKGLHRYDSFTSTEYDDLQLFLDVCAEAGVRPLIVNVPVQGWVYDYMGWPKEARQDYYARIREICMEYDAEIADFSEYEYEPGFIRDSMHLGYEGWAYVDKAVYEFYKSNKSETAVGVKNNDNFRKNK